MSATVELNQIGDDIWEIPKHGEMQVPGRIYGSKPIIDHLLQDVGVKEWNAFKQIENVACLPGIQDASIAMSDVHPGYGFPIGGVGAFDVKKGVVSVAGVGFDCNCGVRCLSTPLTAQELEPKKEALADALFSSIPAGLGSRGPVTLSTSQLDRMLEEGAAFSLALGYGTARDLEYTEQGGVIDGADPGAVSRKAKDRLGRQLGSLGSGNHYAEVQVVEAVFDETIAAAYGLKKDQVIVFIHCGSRALGHQVGADYLSVLEEASRKYGIPIRERELVCAPIQSPEGKRYISAVCAAMNCAFANRQVLGALARKAIARAAGVKESDILQVYDVGHNTCKFEQHGGKTLLVHRKGATRAFGPASEDIPAAYKDVGQPVLVGGTMGTFSYILAGTAQAMKETFGSACHGAGRLMSRVQATKRWRGQEIVRDLARRGIVLRGHSMRGLAEEAPGSYKDVNEVVDVMERTGISKKVVRLKPVVCIKG